MLDKKAKEEIRTIKFSKSIYSKDEKIPTLIEIKKMAIKEISKKEIGRIKRVSPDKANCIIRVYTYSDNKSDKPHSFYGFICFTKESYRWVTDVGVNELVTINFTKQIIRKWIFQDEYEDYECEFVDFYVRIS